MKKTFLSAISGQGLLGSILQTLSTSVLIQVINISTGIITAHTLAPHGRGELAAVMMWPQFLAYTLTFGVPVSLLYCIRREPERRAELLGAALLIGCMSGLLSIIVGIFGIPIWLRDYPPAIIGFAKLMIFAAPLSSISILLPIAAQADQKFSLFNKFRIMPGLLTVSFLAALYYFHHITVYTVAVAYLFASFPTIIWSAIWVANNIHPNLRNLLPSARTLISYGVRAWGGDLVGTISDQIDRVLVVAMLLPEDMGFYVVALSSARIFAIIPSALSNVLFPKLVSLGPTRGAALFLPVCFLVLFFMSLVASPMIFGASFLLKLVYGTSFLPATRVFQVLVVEAIFGGATWMLAQGFSAFGRPGRSSLQQIVGLACAVPLLLILVPRFGLSGAGWAILGSTLIRFSFAIVNYVILFGVNIRVAAQAVKDLVSARRNVVRDGAKDCSTGTI